MKKKKIKRIIIVILILLVLAVGGYFTYFLSSYQRIPNNEYLETQITGAYSYFDDNKVVNTGDYYNIITYNIGYGANTNDYSFFMDGGKYSRAKSEDGLLANLCAITDVIYNSGASFFLLQEVDLDGTRTFNVNEREVLNDLIKGFYFNEAVCYDSPYIFYPIFDPIGKNKSAMLTYSTSRIAEGMRVSLPVSEGFNKYMDYDRCYTVSKIPTANEKMLVLYNVHLSAYSDVSVRDAQLDMLFRDMENNYKMGNYVICGGDFNMNLRDEELETDLTWCQRFPREKLPKGFEMGIDYGTDFSISHNSCRNTNEPYNEDTTFTVTTDGFIVSDNVMVHYYNNMNCHYEFSDHDPVLLQIYLKE